MKKLTGNNLVETDASAQSYLEYSGTGAATSWIVLNCKHSGEVCQSTPKETFPWFLRTRDDRTPFLVEADLSIFWRDVVVGVCSSCGLWRSGPYGHP